MVIRPGMIAQALLTVILLVSGHGYAAAQAEQGGAAQCASYVKQFHVIIL